MKYRAVALGFERWGRPLQSYSQNLERIRDWANKVGNKENVEVEIYIVEERFLETVHPLLSNLTSQTAMSKVKPNA